MSEVLPIRMRTNPEHLGGVGRKPTGKRLQMRASAASIHYPLGGGRKLQGGGGALLKAFLDG